VHPRLVEEIGDELTRLNELQEAEHDVLEKQSEQLFSKDNKGVANAVDGIRDYCELSAFKEMAVEPSKLPWRETQALRVVLSKKNEKEREQMDELDRKNKKPPPRR
jgi:hypothetical protein